ncbi:tyrosine-type recombinase/integrase [Priestia aryabhattai]|uniref:tyrosine-type recombinase/integrase n=1 Tax=Priestia aryabhattai TaxID=412384 RepID=UPI00159BBE47|nr:tyrosine-type recombinase/integrase [Priestia aryabhattai]
MSANKRKLRRKITNSNHLTIDEGLKIVTQVKTLEGLSEGTLQLYRIVFNDLKVFFGNDKLLNEIDLNDARSFFSWQLHEKVLHDNSNIRQIKNQGVQASSANTYLIKLRAAFNLLLKEGLLETNVFVEIKNIKFQKKKIKTLSIEEIKRILNAFDQTYYSQYRSYVLLYTLFDSMGRIQEVLHLTESDIDFERRAITFQKTKNKCFRIVPISKKTCQMLQTLIMENKEAFDTDLVFVTNHGNPLKPDTFRTHVNRILKEKEIAIDFHPHLLRHSASQMFLEQSGNIKVLQILLGHSDLSITSRVYAHVLDSTLIEQHNQYAPIKRLEEQKEKVVKRKQK